MTDGRRSDPSFSKAPPAPYGNALPAHIQQDGGLLDVEQALLLHHDLAHLLQFPPQIGLGSLFGGSLHVCHAERSCGHCSPLYRARSILSTLDCNECGRYGSAIRDHRMKSAISAKMKRTIPLLFSLLFGIGVGWYFSYTRPSAIYRRELQQQFQQYQTLRDTDHLTDAELAQIVSKMPQYFEDMKRGDAMTTIFAIGTYNALEQGNTEGAKSNLVQVIGDYYREHHGNGGDPALMSKIEEFARKYPAIAAVTSHKDG